MRILALALMCIFVLTACNGTNNRAAPTLSGAASRGPTTGTAEAEVSQLEDTIAVNGIVSYIGTDKTYELTAEETTQIVEIMETGTWNTGGTADCANDYMLTIDGETYSYHSECGTLNDNLNNRCLTVTDTEKENINTVLNQCVTLDLPTGIENLTPLSFSYEEDTAVYKDGDPGVNPHAFANVNSQPIDSQDTALELAKNECTVEYDTTNIYYDRGTAMWKVAFFTAGILGGDQTVYLDGNGITRLVVYGE